ncbi:glycosyltransferase family 4 protein [Halobacillus yeomjeoni]|uniref:Glycosyltransferase family 4 protein n=1 Tax=Halobacillus yeomjeoni TaxID=311194 RepID=A0A931HWL8_9BACI|nr:glycosyltransferase family 4 protein [Halobacillus yeomjeoni]MBH0230710.1 glycosyltransferase family 4 protein [Halobacillus yeomjeoni]
MKKKVLQVGPLPPPIGGMSVFLQQLKNFKSERYELDFFNIFPKKNKPLNKLANNALILGKFFWALKKEKPDLVHIHTAAYRAFTKSRYLVGIAKKLGFPVVLHIHSGKFIEFYRGLSVGDQRTMDETLQKCDRIVCLSPTWKSQFVENFPVEEDRFTVVPNAIFVDQFKDVTPLPADEGKVVLFVGKVGENKGILDIIEIAKKLKERSDVKFLVMGNGPLDQHLKREIEEHDLNMEQLGTLHGDDKIEHYKRANVFILPSYFEALGLSNLEGMAAGHVVLSTRVGAVPDIIHDGEEGYLFQPGDVDGFVNKIVELDAETMNGISVHNREKAKDYDFQELNERLESLYDEMID